MTTQELIYDIYYAYRGKGLSKTPTWGEEKSDTALAIANRKIREWATDSNNRWASLFEIRSVNYTAPATAIQSTVKSYELDTDFFAPSDYARVDLTNGNYVEYPITTPQTRNLENGQSLYISGYNPQIITFNQDIDTSIVGGDLKVPGYFIPTALANATDVVPVDDPIWLVYATASELARNDPAKDDQYANLAGMANDLYRKMIDKNIKPGFLQGGLFQNLMPVIGQESED